MNRKALLSLCLLGAPLLPASAEQPSANQILRCMSDTLAAAQTFRFSATREADAALADGIEPAGRKVNVEVLVQRPNKIAVRSRSKAGERQFIADGRTLTIYESKTNFYSVSRIPGTIDSLVDELDAEYGFTPPLAEFAVSNPYKDLRRDLHTVAYLGRETVGGGFLGLGGVSCDHLALRGKLADAELWVGANDHLPRQLVATFKLLPSQPQLRIVFRDWNLAAKANAADFTFTPPKGAAEIEMWSVSEMQKSSNAR